MGPSKSGVEHVLIIASLPSGIHWTVLKDDLRLLYPKESRGPGRVDIGNNGCTVKIDCEKDALYIFNKLVTAGLPRFPHTRLLVHYAQTYENGRTNIIRCNSNTIACQAGDHVAGTEEHFHAVQAHYIQGYEAQIAQQALMPAYPVASYITPVDSASPYINMWSQGVIGTVNATPQYQYPGMAVANYEISPTTRLPVNTSGGAIQTESRGIFIRGLPYATTDNQLKKLLKQVGAPLRCDLRKDKNGKPTGSATALFATANEAGIAKGRLDGRKHKGHTLKVRSDRETTSLGGGEEIKKSPGPSLLIVNGSTMEAERADQ